MLRPIGDEIFERCRQLGALLGAPCQPEDLQRDETIAGWVVRAKNGTEAACPNLMQDAKGTTGGGRVESGSVSVQRWCSSAGPGGRRIVTRFPRPRARPDVAALTASFSRSRQYGFRAVAFRPFLDSALRLAVDIRRFPWMRPLALDYAFDPTKVAAFFAGDPAQSESWAAQLAAQRSHARPRAELAR